MMNRLKKKTSLASTQAVSRTMMLAKVAAAEVTTSTAHSPRPHGSREVVLKPTQATPGANKPLPAGPDVRPTTAAEQYWAARALTAEALLSAKAAHQQEMASLVDQAETKRSQEMAHLREVHDSRQSKLERLIIMLSAVLVCLLSIIAYVLIVQSITQHRKSGMHFTIPILSPFASVVEHETSVIGSKMLTVFAVIIAVGVYGCFRFWLTHKATR